MARYVTTKVPDSACVECGYNVDHATGQGTPSPGDLTLCLRCGRLNAFANDLSLCKPTKGQEQWAAADSETQAIRRDILLSKQAGGNGYN